MGISVLADDAAPRADLPEANETGSVGREEEALASSLSGQ
jgi:hypothetical protein